MKYLTLIALVGSVSVYAQNFSPSASGSSLSSPSGSVAPGGAGTILNSPQQNTGFTNPPVGTGTIPNNNTFNTAPTSVPGGQPADTTLLNNNNTAIPSNNPTIQAQEAQSLDAFGNQNTTNPLTSGSGFGTGLGSGTGTGSDNTNLNQTSPISSP